MYSQEQASADIASIKATIPLDQVNHRLSAYNNSIRLNTLTV